MSYNADMKTQDQIRLQAEIQGAVELAVRHHSGAVRTHRRDRPAFLPFVFHTIGVTELVWRWGCGVPKLLRAMPCHDLLEDTYCTFDELASTIGEESATIVAELTFYQNERPPGSREPAKGHTHLEPNVEITKAQWIEGFGKRSPEAIVGKIADRIHNSADFKFTQPDYALKYFNKANPLFHAFHSRRDELVSVFGEPSIKEVETALDDTRAFLKR